MKVTQLLHFLFVTLLILVLASCRDGVVKVDNEMEGKLTATFQLAEKGEKKILFGCRNRTETSLYAIVD